MSCAITGAAYLLRSAGHDVKRDAVRAVWKRFALDGIKALAEQTGFAVESLYRIGDISWFVATRYRRRRERYIVSRARREIEKYGIQRILIGPERALKNHITAAVLATDKLHVI